MARKLRVEYPGAIYHVMNRGDRREPIFRDDADRKRFLETLDEACVRSGWQVHAYCLMSNHFHLVVETPQPTLVAGMKWFLGTYTGRFNRRHKLFGHLFSGRYKSLIESGTAYKPIRRGWYFGAKALKKELLGQMSKRFGPEHYGEERQESQAEQAEQVVMEELRRRRWTETTLGQRKKGEVEKVKIAIRLRKETLVTVSWIAARLQMGSVANVNTLLYRWRQGKCNK